MIKLAIYIEAGSLYITELSFVYLEKYNAMFYTIKLFK